MKINPHFLIWKVKNESCQIRAESEVTLRCLFLQELWICIWLADQSTICYIVLVTLADYSRKILSFSNDGVLKFMYLTRHMPKTKTVSWNTLKLSDKLRKVWCFTRFIPHVVVRFIVAALSLMSEFCIHRRDAAGGLCLRPCGHNILRPDTIWYQRCISFVFHMSVSSASSIFLCLVYFSVLSTISKRNQELEKKNTSRIKQKHHVSVAYRVTVTCSRLLYKSLVLLLLELLHLQISAEEWDEMNSS